MENASTPPQRPPSLSPPPLTQQRPLGLSAAGSPVVTSAVPPLYANSFDVSAGDYDFTLKFQQIDPYLTALAGQEGVAGQQAQLVLSQQPAAVITMSPQALEALWASLGDALGKTPKAAAPDGKK